LKELRRLRVRKCLPTLSQSENVWTPISSASTAVAVLSSSSVHRPSGVSCLIVDDVAVDLLAVAEDVTVLLELTDVLPRSFCSVPNSRWKILFARFFSFLFWQLPCIS